MSIEFREIDDVIIISITHTIVHNYFNNKNNLIVEVRM